MAARRGKVWEGRFHGGPDPEFEAFSRSLHFDVRLAPYEIAVDRVWASALAQVGVYSPADVEAVHRCLDELNGLLACGQLQPDPADEDVHVFLERLLTERLGPVGERIHTGRSRNDLVVTDLKLYLRESLGVLLRAVLELQEALLTRSQEAREVLLPAYTHLQRAQPVSLAHYLLSLFWALDRSVKRISQWLRLHNTCPLGSGACAGSGFPVDRGFVAKALGFGAPSPNSLDAVSSRDFVVDAAHACASLMLDLSRYAEDWILWSTAEFGFLSLDESLTTGSSLMPQKRNPDSLELVRGKAARVLAAEARLQTLLKALPLTYNRDLQEDKEAIFDALDQTLPAVRILAKAVRGMRWNPGRMAGALDATLMATDLADYLVRKGVPFREAHRIVGRMVLSAEETGRSMSEWSVDDFRAFCDLVESDVLGYLKPEHSVARREVEGGTGPRAVEQQLEQAREALRDGRKRLDEFEALAIVGRAGGEAR